MKFTLKACVTLPFVVVFSFLSASLSAFAQTTIEAPQERRLFTRDMEATQTLQKRRASSALSQDAPATADLDFKAPNVEFERDKNIVKGTGGVLISQNGTLAQSETANVDLNTKDGDLKGNVVINTSNATITADTGKFNFDSETGQFLESSVLLEEGGYKAESNVADKLSETKYSLFDTAFTTCHCADGTTPWKINSDKANITQESYAHCYNNSVDFHGIPVFYTPYLAFPVKTERQSGLLAPQYGYGSRDGVLFRQPIFAVIDDTADLTFTPFIETKTRIGSGLDFRKYFSKRSKIDSRIIYSDESRRDGNLRGTVTTGVYDALPGANGDRLIDEDRFLGYYRQLWRNEQDAEVPLQFISDLHYASDDLALREFDDPKIGDPNARYITSRMSARATLTDYLTASADGEYNQFIDMDDDLGFQRLPELNLSSLRSFRPFGYNPLGARLVTRSQLNLTEFVREEGYEGTRVNVVPSFSIPFHYKNYFSSEVGAGMRYTSYNLGDTTDPRSGATLDDSSDRTVFNISYGIGTAVEKVYSLEEDSWLAYITGLGAKNQTNRLKRVKHTIEPFMRYSYVPYQDQADLPFFDSTDRIRQKSVFTYGFTSNLYGRFLPSTGSEQSITELTPRVQELPDINSISSISDMGSIDDYQGLGGSVSSRNGEIRNVASLTMKQAYDYVEDHKDLQEGISAYSDVGTELSLFPTADFALSGLNSYNAEDHRTNYWGIGTNVRDDRGDNLKLLYTYRPEDEIQGTVATSQIEGNVEIVLSEQLRFAAYSLYDEEKSDAIRSRFALRVVSSCNCWNFDVGYSDRLNPDRQQVYVTFTFSGLGDISQRFGVNGNPGGQ